MLDSELVKKLEDDVKAISALQNTSNENNNLPTGDNIGIYVTMFIVSVLGIGKMISIKNKRRNKN